MHKTLRLVAGYYRKTARVFVLVVLVLSVFGPALAAAQSGSNGSLSLALKDIVVGCDTVQLADNFPSDYVTGAVTVSGSWSGGPLTFSGWIYIAGNAGGSPAKDNLTLPSGDFKPSSLSYPSSASANFTSSDGTVLSCFQGVPSWSGKVFAYSGGKLVASGTRTGGSPFSNNNPTYQYIVELPLFNDTMLGASASCNPGKDSPTAFEYPCSLPLDTYYNYIAFVAVVIVGVGYLISMGVSQVDEKEQRKNHLLNLVVTFVFIFAFPLIYNNVASLLNYLNASVIAGPSNANDVSFYLATNINTVWGAATPNAGSVLNFITGVNFLTLAGWLISLFTYIGVYVLGIIRQWLLAVMIVAFPVSLAIKEIPFAKKLSNMIEDTFYGIVLASLMSAIIIGLAANVLGSASGGTLNNSTIFGGGDATFVASIALLTAIFMPTILAPLASTLMQTGMQMSMAAGSIAALGAMGGTSGLAGGIGGAISPATLGAKSGLGAAAFEGMSTGERLAASMEHGTLLGGLRTGALHGFKNVGLGVMTGVMGGMGMGQAQKMIGRIVPMSTPSAVSESIQYKTEAGMQAQQMQNEQNFINTATSQIGVKMPVFAAGAPSLSLSTTAAERQSVENLQRLARSDDYRGGYNYVSKHRHAFSLREDELPPVPSEKAQREVGGKFIDSLRPYKDDPATLHHIGKQMNDAHQWVDDDSNPLRAR